MPFTQFYYNPEVVPKGLADKITNDLPGIIAPQLSIAGRKLGDGRVSPKDIIVKTDPTGDSDVNVRDIMIMIWTHDFPERRENPSLEVRKENILKGVRETLDSFQPEYSHKVTGFVWIFPGDTAFGSI